MTYLYQHSELVSHTEMEDIDVQKFIKPFKCTVAGCNASFAKHYRLKIHIRQHTGERPFVCEIFGCKKSYTNSQHLKRHKDVVHSALEEVMCEVPGCGLVLSDRQNLKKHQLRKHDPNYTPYKCAECNETFKKKKLLRKHLESHFPEKYLKCESCIMNFSDKLQYLKHKRNHKSYDCDCGTSFHLWSKFCEHRKSCGIKRIDHKCTICSKVFTTNSNLRAHALVHAEESRSEVYRCVYLNCSRSYKYKKNLMFHVRHFHEKHIEDVEIKCTFPECHAVLKSKKNLKQHIANMHSDKLKPFKPRKKRKDKGIPRKKMINYLTGVNTISAVSVIKYSQIDTSEDIGVTGSILPDYEYDCEGAEVSDKLSGLTNREVENENIVETIHKSKVSTNISMNNENVPIIEMQC